MNNNNYLLEFISSFFRLFQANIEKIRIDEKIISGVIHWEEEVKQEFSWEVPENVHSITDTMELINYLIENHLLNGDMINIEKQLLIKTLSSQGWDNQKINNSIDFLCSVRVAMIDDGLVTDHFLIHF
jgi:hypothetical protein